MIHSLVVILPFFLLSNFRTHDFLFLLEKSFHEKFIRSPNNMQTKLSHSCSSILRRTLHLGYLTGLICTSAFDRINISNGIFHESAGSPHNRLTFLPNFAKGKFVNFLATKIALTA